MARARALAAAAPLLVNLRVKLLVKLLVPSLLLGAACRPHAEPAVGPVDAATPATRRWAMLDAERDRVLKPDLLVTRLGLHAGMTVADLGAGPGYLTLRLARAVSPTGHVIATDVDGAALVELGERARAVGLFDIETRRVGADEPGLAPSLVDLALLVQVAPFLPDLATWLARLAPSLRPGGRLCAVGFVSGRDALVTAALRAGWRVVDEDRKLLPTQYLVFFSPERVSAP